MSPGQSSPAPPGLQAERTALAWRRTALAVAAGSLVTGRLVAPGLGNAGWVLAGVGVLLAAVVGLTAHRRWLGWHRAITYTRQADDDAGHDAAPPPPVAPGGEMPTACAAGSLMLGMLAFAAVVTHAG